MRAFRGMFNRGKPEGTPLLPASGDDARSSLAGSTSQGSALGSRVLPPASSSGQVPTAQGPVTVTPPEERRSNSVAATVAVTIAEPSAPSPLPEVAAAVQVEEPPATEVPIDGWDPRKECLRDIQQRIASLTEEISGVDRKQEASTFYELSREHIKLVAAKADIERSINSSSHYRLHPLLNGTGEQATNARKLVMEFHQARADLSLEDPKGNHYDDEDYDDAVEGLLTSEAQVRAMGIDPNTV